MASKPPQAVALVSGGMDSAVAAGLIRREGFDMIALSFDYGQRHKVELEAAKRVAAWLQASERLVIRVELDKIGCSALTDKIEVPKNRTGDDIPVTYVPGRNLVFLSVALSLAEARGASRIVIGANAIDFSGYPDCRPEFIAAFQEVARVGTKVGIEGKAPLVTAPLMDMDKAAIVKAGLALGLDFAITSSCYDPFADGRPCGSCDACRLRRKGFAEARCRDPLEYPS